MANPNADYPNAVHTPIDVPSLADETLGSTSPTHTEVHGKVEEEIVALQQKVGIGASPASSATDGQVLTKQADGSTAWQDAAAGGAVSSVNTQTGDVVLDADDIDDASTTNKFTTQSDIDRLANTSGNNTGDQNLSGYQLRSEKGISNGYAELDSSGLVPSGQLPSYVDDVLEYANFAALPGTGVTGKIYVTLNTNLTYRWSGSAYVEISASPDIAATIHAASSKTTPVDADELGLVDSAASNVLKKLTWSNLKATLKTYFDPIYQAALGYTAENVANKDTDGTLAANSDTKYASQKATKTYSDTKIAKSFIDAKGDIIAGTADNTPVIVPIGTDGQVLTADSASTPGLKWATPSAGGGLGLTPTAVKTANYTASVGDLVLADTNTTGAFTVTLPSAPADKSLVAIKHVLQGSTSNYPNAVTVARGGTDTFDKASGPTTVTMPLLNSLMVFQYQSATGVWHQISDHRDLSVLDSRLLGATTIIPQSAYAGTGADMMTPLVSGNSPGTYTLAVGTVILAMAIHSGQTINVLEVIASATSLTAGQGITVGCYAYNADGTIGKLLWSQVITIGTSTSAVKVTGLSKVMPTGRCVIAVLNPSTNAGSVTLRAQTAQIGRGFPIDFQNGAFSHSLLSTGRSALDADLSSVLFRSAVATNELTPGPISFPIIGAWT